MDFYSVLGVSPDADEEAIRHAYRALARRYHPDRGPGSCAEKFRQLTHAYEAVRNHGSPAAQVRPVPTGLRATVVQNSPYPREDAAVFGWVPRTGR